MTGMLNNFIAVMMLLITGFSSSYQDVNMVPRPDRERTAILTGVDEAAAVAQSGNVNAGIVVIDRAKGNYMATNGEAAYTPTPIYTLGRLPILLHAIRVDPQIVNDSGDILKMMEGSSAEATERSWDRFGGPDIIRSISERYSLEQTKPGQSWSETVSTPVDIARMYRRFFDDREVSIPQKKWVMTILRKTSPTIMGEDFSWGLPSAMDVTESADPPRDLGWVQGYSPAGADPMIRATSGMVGDHMRYIVVILNRYQEGATDESAARMMTTVTGLTTDTQVNSSGGNRDDTAGEEFDARQEALYGDFVGGGR